MNSRMLYSRFGKALPRTMNQMPKQSKIYSTKRRQKFPISRVRRNPIERLTLYQYSSNCGRRGYWHCINISIIMAVVVTFSYHNHWLVCWSTTYRRSGIYAMSELPSVKIRSFEYSVSGKEKSGDWKLKNYVLSKIHHTAHILLTPSEQKTYPTPCLGFGPFSSHSAFFGPYRYTMQGHKMGLCFLRIMFRPLWTLVWLLLLSTWSSKTGKIAVPYMV